MIRALSQDLDLQLRLPVNINVFEMQAIPFGFQLHTEKWVDSIIIIYTDSTMAFRRLQSQRFRGPFN